MCLKCLPNLGFHIKHVRCGPHPEVPPLRPSRSLVQDEARKTLLRTHTTAVSALNLAWVKKLFKWKAYSKFVTKKSFASWANLSMVFRADSRDSSLLILLLGTHAVQNGWGGIAEFGLFDFYHFFEFWEPNCSKTERSWNPESWMISTLWMGLRSTNFYL